ncbi:MAG: hypothetical protein GY866_27865 [Proteobacteria bacterium]|nr:hypothetical protein [Pseudomonadota bacterium]
MAKVEKIDKWLESTENEDDLLKKSKKKKKNQFGVDLSKTEGMEKKSTRPSRSDSNIGFRIQDLLKESPDSPIFLGKKKLTIQEPKKRGFFKRSKYPDLTKLRVDLNTLTDKGKVDLHSRQKVRMDLKKFPDVPDLHVINAVYTYQDIPRQTGKEQVSQLAQNKLNENQLVQLKKAIHEIVLAFHHGGLSVFNANWFMKIYIEYLNVYKGRLTYEYKNVANRGGSESSQLASKIRTKQTEIIELMSIKEKIGGMARLGRRLNGTTYLSDAFTQFEIKRAAQAMKNGELTKTIGEGRTAAKTLIVLMTMLFMLAKVPILKNLVEEILAIFPDDDRGIILRKRMVATIMKCAEFELALVGGDKSKTRQAANVLYTYCLKTIEEHIQGTMIKEQYEIDPFLKAVWLVKSADGLFSKSNYKVMVDKAYNLLEKVTGDSNHLREKSREMVVDLATKYSYQLDSIMDRHGWIGKSESMAWQNREVK